MNSGVCTKAPEVFPFVPNCRHSPNPQCSQLSKTSDTWPLPTQTEFTTPFCETGVNGLAGKVAVFKD